MQGSPAEIDAVGKWEIKADQTRRLGPNLGFRLEVVEIGIDVRKDSGIRFQSIFRQFKLEVFRVFACPQFFLRFVETEIMIKIRLSRIRPGNKCNEPAARFLLLQYNGERAF